jgi:hypothetical protein
MSAFFCGITEPIPSLFRRIVSERNSVANPTSILFVAGVVGTKKSAMFHFVLEEGKNNKNNSTMNIKDRGKFIHDKNLETVSLGI